MSRVKTNTETAYDGSRDSELELNDEQLGRVGEIYNAAHEFIKVLLENPDMDFDQHYAGNITETAVSYLASEGFKIRYPGIADDNGRQYIEEFYQAH